MPKRFTPEELEASAAAGAPRNEASFAGDATAWHSYQDAFFKTIKLGEELPPYGDACRAALWKAARRQRGKIEEQRVEGRQAESNTERMRAARRDDEYRSPEALAKRKQAEAEKRADEAYGQLYDRQMAHFVHLLREAGATYFPARSGCGGSRGLGLLRDAHQQRVRGRDAACSSAGACARTG